ncbi:hypothetical protein [Paenibacillus crassostreae]|uniref:Uncharacterized protein n=1 Tax=Paenibacillus crassostreae TaxID=1763538 RepID=A0A167AGI0_9BACL|nr:hypothetical protein [Paenibacillus crassostreae]AOZ92278.1 hypothetical protein LPB68_08600 [Paenibacillus crassostreae]OAB70995.1 hypothetical protein PNBC_20750 [Paenibacillus crassostreae]
MTCTHCGKEMDEKYIIDARGTEYCSEDCMEEYQDKHDIEPHPYEDSYLILRHAYTELLDTWEQTLCNTVGNLEDVVDELLEEMDELIGEHDDFIRAEGDDGPYAWEIYQYTLKLRELQRCIFAWRPNRKVLYWVDGSIEDYRVSDEQQEEIYNRICTDLYLDGYEEFILYVIKNHQYPWRDRLNYVFDNEEMAQEAFEILKPFCDKRGVELSIVESYKCEAYCGDILEVDADTYINGWFYCYSCKGNGEHGIFTPQELEAELQYYEGNEEERQVVIYERRDWCFPYKKKIKRTCREFEVEVPGWAE